MIMGLNRTKRKQLRKLGWRTNAPARDPPGIEKDAVLPISEDVPTIDLENIA